MTSRMILLSALVAGAVATATARPVPTAGRKVSVKQESNFEELPTCAFVDPCNGKTLFGFPDDITDSCGNEWEVDWDCHLEFIGPPGATKPKKPAPFNSKPGEEPPTAKATSKPFPPSEGLHQLQEFEGCAYVDPCNGETLSGLLEEVTDSCGASWWIDWDCEIALVGPFTRPKPRVPQRTTVEPGPPAPPKPAKTEDSDGDANEVCTFKDDCDGDSISADVGELFVDSCGTSFEVLPGCTREEIEEDDDDCTYDDACNGETISANVGEVLTDSCGTSWTVGPACERN